jgi:hypothetical protein
VNSQTFNSLSNVVSVGHGRSEGERTMIDTFDTYVEDTFTHCDQMKELYPDIPIYLFGHSMVGAGRIANRLYFLFHFCPKAIVSQAICFSMGMAGSHESHIPMLVGYVEYILIQFKN